MKNIILIFGLFLLYSCVGICDYPPNGYIKNNSTEDIMLIVHFNKKHLQSSNKIELFSPNDSVFNKQYIDTMKFIGCYKLKPNESIRIAERLKREDTRFIIDYLKIYTKVDTLNYRSTKEILDNLVINPQTYEMELVVK